MKTRLKIAMIVAATAIISSTVTAIIIPKETTSFYPEWLEKNIDAAHKINDSDIPIKGVDVDEQLAVLTIYMTEETYAKHKQAIDDLIDVPYEILTDAESKELKCLRLYRDIMELSKTKEMQLAEKSMIQKQKRQLTEYVKSSCPDFKNLDLMYESYNRTTDSLK